MSSGDDELPATLPRWEIPSDWQWVSIADVGKIITGNTPPTKDESNYGNFIPFVKPPALTDKGIRSTPEGLSETGVQSSRTLPAGAVLVSCIGGLGKTGIAKVPVAFNQQINAIVFDQRVVPEFGLYYAQTLKPWLHGVASATTLPIVNKGKFQRAPFPLAPLDQQKRIVSEIEKQFSRLDEAVANLKRVKANLKRYKAAVLKAAVEGKLTEAWRKQHPDTEPASELLKLTVAPPRPNRYSTRSMDVIPGHAALAVGNPCTALPDGWSWSALVDIARMESGHTPSRGHPEWWEGDVPWIGIADAREHHGKLIADTVQHTNDAGLANSAARLLPAGTVCISRTASVGYVVVMGKSMATSQDFVNWTPTKAVTSDWLRIVFLVDREALIRFGKGSVHKTIYFPEWLSMHIAVPPLAEQNHIIAEVERLLSLADEAEAQVNANLQRAVSLRQSILQRAFSQ
jgi:type I restriction enzyme S subunit